MDIDEALRRLEYFLDKHRSHMVFEDRQALAVSIEALKRYKDLRRLGDPVNWKPLPGETKEGGENEKGI